MVSQINVLMITTGEVSVSSDSLKQEYKCVSLGDNKWISTFVH